MTNDAERAERFLDSLNPDVGELDDPVELRRIGLAVRGVEAAQEELSDAVAAARAKGRPWSQIGMVLGVSRQAAQERFGSKISTG